MRKPAEEKALLTEFGKLFHLAKAQHKEQKQQPQAPQNAKKDRRGGAAADTRRGSQRRSRHGASIWMVLKGGFGPHAVPTAAQASTVADRRAQRATLSEHRRLAALKAAEAYIESAWQQARESDLVNSDSTPTEEGDAYLAEQYATASQMLCPAPAGGFLHQLVETHSAAPSATAAAEVDAAEAAPPAPLFKLSRAEWEDVVTREAAILFRYKTRATPSTSAEEYFKAQQHAREQLYTFATAEPTVQSGADVAPTKCIVRVRDSQRNKHTAILSTAKAVNYFKSNIGQVLRKELASSRLPRGGAEETDGNTAGAGGAGAAGTGAAKSGSNNNNNNANSAHSSKKKRKR